jgi:hypothetical protein
MNRGDLQKIALMRVEEARILLAKKHFDGAYYLLGYAVECALKSRIAKQIKKYDFPDKNVITDAYTHNLENLLNQTGLKSKLTKEAKKNQALDLNWAIVKDWSEAYRYKHGMAERKARDIFNAVTADKVGILPWLKKYW